VHVSGYLALNIWGVLENWIWEHVQRNLETKYGI